MSQPLPTVIHFVGLVTDVTVNALMSAVTQKLHEGQTRFTLLISTPGGSVFHGLTAYNFLRGIPADVTTHNVGSVDSIGVVLFCGGKQRLSVPQARFLLHSVTWGFAQGENLEEKQIEERLKGLQLDLLNIARVVAANSRKTEADVIAAMHDRSTLDPEQAKAWGLVADIRAELFPPGSEVINIFYQQQQPTRPSSDPRA